MGAPITMRSPDESMHKLGAPQAEAEASRYHGYSDVAAVETDHRVANSLSLVATLLRMQRVRSTEAAVRDAILSAEARVASIAQLHAYLHKHSARDRIDLADYLCDVLPEIGSGIGIQCFLAINISDPIEVSGRLATQLTIVVNELALNALKHGYGGREGGHVSFTLDNDGGAGLRLSVADSGSGLPDDFDPESGGGVGLRIVSTAVRGLGGSITSQTNGGAQFTISIPIR